MTRALAFLSDAPPGLGSRFARLRWRRAVRALNCEDWAPGAEAAPLVGKAEVWFVVTDPDCLPVPAQTDPLFAPAAGRILVARNLEVPAAHTLRELEAAGPGLAARDPGIGAAAIAFRATDFPAESGETCEQYIHRLRSLSAARDAHPAFQAVSLGEPAEGERPELTRRLPSGPLRILDAGCGAGAGIAGAKARNPGWNVTGIERDPRLAARARERCDRVLEGDLRTILPALEGAGERFDAVVFADVLEHLEDPVAALARGRSVTASGGRLVASVPNVGHLSLARDLVLGRFDPVPAGHLDAGHVRWFSRALLEEALAESGWSAAAIESEPGAPPPDADAFLALAATWPDADREGLLTYQWVATAVNRTS